MTAPATATRPPSLWEDLLEIFYAPTAVFERRRETPAFGLALLIFVVLGVVLFFAFRNVTQPLIETEIRRGMVQAMKSNPQITPEMVPRMVEAASKWAIVGVVGVSALLPLVLGLLLWLVGKVVESKAELGQLMMVGTYAVYPRLIEAITNAVQLLLIPEENIRSRFSVQLGVARFLDPDKVSPVLLALLGRLDLFTLWITLLLGIGLSVMGRIPRGRAMIAAALVWVIGAIPALLGTIRGS
jgi:hypothetical protein